MSGWKNMSFPPRLVLLTMILTAPIAHSQTEQEAEIPTEELLEFLGEWETEDGEWLDPEELEEEDFAELLQITDDE